jgi:hypothetical protein
MTARDFDLSHLAQRRFEVGDQIVGVFDPD